MNKSVKLYKCHRFPHPGDPPAIIQYAVWLYHRFNLSHRDTEDLLAERGITVSREVIRLWRAVDQDGELVDVFLQSRRYQ